MGLLFVGLGTAHAQLSMPQDYDKFIHSAEAVGALGPELFGEQVSLYTGSTEFTVTDIELPGSGLIPVRLGRRYVVDEKQDLSLALPMNRPSYPFGDWQLDIPHLHGTFARSAGWVSDSSQGRCDSATDVAEPPQAVGVLDWFSAWEYWHGNHLYVPGQGDQEMLVLHDDGNPHHPPHGDDRYRWVTQQQWFFRCLSNLANSAEYPGQGFLAIDPEGTQYTFDWMVAYKIPRLTKPAGLAHVPVQEPPPPSHDRTQEPTPDIPPAFPAYLERDEVWIYPTEIKDRFGNTVTFRWSGGQLTNITASDQRMITLAYTGGRISAATVTTPDAGTRTWTYCYDNSKTCNATGTRLTKAVRPDNSAWSYSMSPLESLHTSLRNSPLLCGNSSIGSVSQTPQSATLVHPSGAIGVFTFKPTEHGRSNVAEYCFVADLGTPQEIGIALHPKYFVSLALQSKAISGPGLAGPLSWTYAYGPPNASWSTACGTGCITTKTLEVTGPDEFARYTFSNKYAESEGKLVKQETGPNASAILRTETLDYQLSATGLAYPDHVGHSPMSRTDGMAGNPVPQKGRSVVQNGATFSSSVAAADFDLFARPTKTTYTGIAGGSGVQRVESVQYHDHLANWVLGQTKKRICTSTTVAGATGCSNTTISETTFDADTALPLTHAAYGQVLQTLVWNADGTLYSSKDALNHITTFTNWHRGVPQAIGFADNNGMSAHANGFGWVTSITNELGDTTDYGYDAMGRLNGIAWPTGDSTAWTSTSRSFAPLTTLTGDDTGIGVAIGQWKLTETTGAAKKETYFDALWRPVLTREQDTGNATTKRYVKRKFDSAGRETFVSYPTASYATTPPGVSTTYDALGRVTKVEQDAEDVNGDSLPDVLTTNTFYESPFKTRTVDPKGHQTTTTYLAIGEPDYSAPQVIAEPGNVTTTIARDVFGKPLTITRSGSYNGVPQSQTRRFLYDAQQRLCKRLDPESGATLFDYDAAGNLAWSARSTSLTNTTTCQRESVAASTRSVRSYDARNRLLGIDHPSGTDDVGYTYYADGTLWTASTPNGGTWTYTYNKRQLPTGESLAIDGNTFAIGYGYSALGHRASMTYPSGLLVNFAPNALGQPTQAGSFANAATYHPNGSLKGFTYGNGMIHSRSLNARGLPLRIRDYQGSAVRLDHTYSYDANGNLTQIDDPVLDPTYEVTDRESRTLAYDERDRLVLADAMGKLGYQSFEYDALDNVRRWDIWRNDELGQYDQDYRYVYDSAGRLDRLDDPSGDLQWDYTVNGYGETTYRKAVYDYAGISGRTWYYSWDAAGRMTAGGGEVYRYDAHGRRSRSSKGSGLRYQVYTRAGQLVYSQDSSTGQNKRIDYISLGGRLVAERSRPLSGSTASTAYLHADQRGTPSVKTNVNGYQSDRNIALPYGSPADSNFREGPGFTGHQTDSGTMLIYMQQRYFDPVAQRFLSTDPVDVSTTDGGNFNRYWYANNNPYRFTDPDGRNPLNPFDAYSFAKDVGGLIVTEMVAGAAFVMGDNDVLNMALNDMSAGALDAALSTADFASPVGGAGRSIKAARMADNIASNAAKGAKAEAAVAAKLGDQVAGQRVTLEATTGQRSVADIVTKDGGVVEVKSGGARLSPGQKAVQADINAGRPVTPRGQNAANAGLTPNQPTTMTCYDVARCQ